MPYPLISAEMLEERVGPDVIGRVCDLENSGELNLNLELRIRADASAKVLGILGVNYGDGINVLRDMTADELPDEVVRIATDAAHAFIACRYPTICAVDGPKMMKQVESDLKGLRLNRATLGITGPPEPAINSGAEAFSLDPTTGYEPEPQTFANGFGDF